MYYPQKQLKYFGLEILAVYGLIGHFELQQAFVYNFVNLF